MAHKPDRGGSKHLIPLLRLSMQTKRNGCFPGCCCFPTTPQEKLTFLHFRLQLRLNTVKKKQKRTPPPHVCLLQNYLIEETVVSYLDVRRRVRDSLKHVYLADRPKGAQCPMGPEKEVKIYILFHFHDLKFCKSVTD